MADNFWNTGSDIALPVDTAPRHLTAEEKAFFSAMDSAMQGCRRVFGVDLPADIERRRGVTNRRFVNVRQEFGRDRRAS